jgi:hypothetical protein
MRCGVTQCYMMWCDGMGWDGMERYVILSDITRKNDMI